MGRFVAPLLAGCLACAAPAVALARPTRADSGIDPFVQQQQLTAPDAGGEFGDSVALSANGDTALVGSSGDGTGGEAFVFTRTGSTWTETQELTGDGQVGTGEVGPGDFGDSVALSSDGETAVVGAEDDAGTGSSIPGAAWVFSDAGGTWVQVGAKLVGDCKTSCANDGTGEVVSPSGGQFGASVAVSGDGDTVLIGAPTDGTNNQGAAWAFSRSGSAWTPDGGKLTADDEATDGFGFSQFGTSVALSSDGDTALIGGPFDGTTSAGAAWAFTRTGSTFAQQPGKLTPGDETTGDASSFGQSVALSAGGTTALIGGPTDGSGAGPHPAGAAWIYTSSPGGFTEQQKLTADGSGDVGSGEVGGGQFGSSVALSGDGDTALVGGFGDNDGVGAGWVFTLSGTWMQVGDKLTASNETGPGSQLGSAAALSADGNTMLFGGPVDGSSLQGAAWVFVAPPAIATVAPMTGPVAGGTPVVIIGSNFTGTTGVSFGSGAATFTVGSPEEITAVTPPGAPGTVPITITTTAGTTSAGSFTYEAPVLPPLTLSGVSQSNKRWVAGSKLAAISAKRPKTPVGTTFSFTLNEPATVALAFTEDRPGRKHGKGCVAETRKNRKHRKCTRTSSAGTLTLSAPAGADRLAFYGLLNDHRGLKPGSYTVAIRATNTAGVTSSTSRLSFTIVAAKRGRSRSR
jgi:hypothetical protein